MLIFAGILCLIIWLLHKILFKDGFYKSLQRSEASTVSRWFPIVLTTVLAGLAIWATIYLSIICLSGFDHMTAFVLWVVAAIIVALWTNGFIKTIKAIKARKTWEKEYNPEELYYRHEEYDYEEDYDAQEQSVEYSAEALPDTTDHKEKKPSMIWFWILLGLATISLGIFIYTKNLPEAEPTAISSTTGRGEYIYIETEKVWKLDSNSDWHYYLACDRDNNFCIIVVSGEGDFYKLYARQQDKVSGITKYFDIRNTDEKKLKSLALYIYNSMSGTSYGIDDFGKVIGDYAVYKDRDPYEWKEIFALLTFLLGLFSLFGTFPRMFYHVIKSHAKDERDLIEALGDTEIVDHKDVLSSDDIFKAHAPEFNVPAGEKRVFRTSIGIVMVFEGIILLVVLLFGGIMIHDAISTSELMPLNYLIAVIVSMVGFIVLPFVIWWCSVLIVTKDYVERRSFFVHKKIAANDCIIKNTVSLLNGLPSRDISIYKKTKPMSKKPYISIIIENYKNTQKVELMKIFTTSETRSLSE